MMDPEIKAKWLKKLRSGEYEQGKEKLLADDKYCCLGVLCNVLPGVKFEARKYANGLEYMELVEPDGVRKTTGSLLSKSLCGIDEQTQRTLAKKNDSGETFEQIADWIEANL